MRHRKYTEHIRVLNSLTCLILYVKQQQQQQQLQSETQHVLSVKEGEDSFKMNTFDLHWRAVYYPVIEDNCR